MKIFKYLKNSVSTVIIIVFLLIAQAFCELSLPTYTSDIIDVGIQQSGIEDCAISSIKNESFEDLKLFIEDKDIDFINKFYNKKDNIYTLENNISKDDRKAISDILSVPMVIVSSIKQSNEMDFGQIKNALSAGIITKDKLLTQAYSLMENSGIQSELILKQLAVSYIKDEYLAQGKDLTAIQNSYMIKTGAKMIGLTLLAVATAILVGFFASKTAAKISMQLRNNIYKKVNSFSAAEIDKFSTASLITRSTNDIQQVQIVIVMILRMVLYAPIMGIGGVIKVSNTKTGMAWIIVVAVITIMILIGLLISIAMPKFKKMQSLVDRLNLVSRETLTGIPVIRAFSREKHEEQRFDTANRNLMKTQLFTNRLMSLMMPVMMLIMNCITISIVWFGAKGIDLGNLQVGDMMAFITYTMQIVMSFMMITMISIMLPRANVAASRIDEVLNTTPSIKDKDNALDKAKNEFKGEVSFNNVSFHFPDADEDVLENINFTASPGKITAIIGSTGSGKSVLVNLILRLYDVTKGSITIDGIDIKDLSQHSLHSVLGYVPQKSFLFSGDIESNIKYGGNFITDENMKEAVSIAQASDFINQKEEGFNSPIAQGGTNVSGGQKQRLSIARAIAINPKVYIFDDSFSALDYKTDATLRKALSSKVKDATVIIVAQRISTVLHADQILVLDDGKIVGIGTHRELLKSCEEYKEIASSQLSEKELYGKGGEIK